MGKNRISGNSEFLTKINSFLAKVLILYPQKTPNNFWFSGLFSGYKTGVLSRNEFRVPQPSSENLFVSQIRVIHSRQVKRLRFFTLQHEKLLDIKSRYVGSFFLEARSLVCFKKDMYTSYMHGIEEIYQDNLEEKNILNKSNLFSNFNGNMERSRRVSLTIRHFPKILNVRLKLGRK